MAKNKTSLVNPVLVGKPQPLHTNPNYPQNPYQSPNPIAYLPSQPLPTPVTGDYGAGSNPYSGLIGNRPPFPVHGNTGNNGGTGGTSAGNTGNTGTGNGAGNPTSPTTPTDPSNPSNPTNPTPSNPYPTNPTDPYEPSTGNGTGNGNGTGTTPYPVAPGAGTGDNPYNPYEIPYYAQPIAPDTHGYYDQLVGYGRDEYTAQAQQILEAQRKGNIAAYNAYLNAINPYGAMQERLAMGNQVNSGVKDYSRQKAYRNMRDYIVDANASANQSYLDLILAYQKQLEAEKEAGLT